MDTTAYTIVAGFQLAFIAAALVVGALVSLKSANLSGAFIWGLARTVVIFLPMALAWFSLFCGMFFQDGNLLIPVLVGVTAVGLNFAIDKLLQWRMG